METFNEEKHITNGVIVASAMDLDDLQLQQPDISDPFIEFIDYARSILSPQMNEDDEDGEITSDSGEREREGPGWTWIASRVLKTCISYSSGVTSAILLSELSQVTVNYYFFFFVFFLTCRNHVYLSV